MSTNQDTISPLRRRMIEDMTIRHLTAKTQGDYIRHVRAFAVFLRRSPDLAEPEDLRCFQLHMAAEGASPSLASRGREGLSPSPPSEPCGRFSRTRLSSWWFPHRGLHAARQAVSRANSPAVAK